MRIAWFTLWLMFLIEALLRICVGKQHGQWRLGLVQRSLCYCFSPSRLFTVLRSRRQEALHLDS
ncbi:MAG: hypothetical protein RMJ82_13985 [Gemmatales bacterium]|nr:hypothetical protein [Gemmatales bacterium]